MLCLNVPLTTILNKLLLIKNCYNVAYVQEECNIHEIYGWMGLCFAQHRNEVIFLYPMVSSWESCESLYSNISNTDDLEVLNNLILR